ncbi:MAG: hypothetical protein Q8O07_01370 [Chloroflexota bacterium]|nr:hypothetical protein [Chloroflexota bacterium]
MDLLQQFGTTLALACVVIWLLSRSAFDRLPQGTLWVVGAVIIGLIALLVFVGPLGGAVGLGCGGGVIVVGGLLYALVWLM